MRIVIIDKEVPKNIDGMGMYSKRLASFLKEHGHDVIFLRYTNASHGNDRIIPLPYYYSEFYSGYFLPKLGTYTNIKNTLINIRPDIVYDYLGLSPLDFLLPGLCDELGIPLTGVWHADNSASNALMHFYMHVAFLLYMPLVRKLSVFHVFSEGMKQLHVRHGVDPKKLLVLTNGVDDTFFTPGPSQFAQKNDIQNGILFFGRLCFQKNPAAILEAFMKINPPHDTKLILMGGGELESKLRKIYHDPRIIFTGIIRDEEKKRDIIRSCQIIVQPSLMEGVSLALLEAMACGLVPITSDVGGYRRLLAHAGKVIPLPSMQNDLPITLTTFLKDKKNLAKMSKTTRNIIHTKHNQELVYNTLIQAFTNAIKIK